MRRRLLLGVLCLLLWSVPFGPTGAIGLDRSGNRGADPLVELVTQAVEERQPPAGAMAVSVRARPRRSSSKATQPPSELPTICAVSQPI